MNNVKVLDKDSKSIGFVGDVILQDDVEEINPYAFAYCESLNKVVISDKELMDIAKKCVSYLKKNYPQFNFWFFI